MDESTTEQRPSDVAEVSGADGADALPRTEDPQPAQERREAAPTTRLVSLVLIGAAIGTWGTVCGIGGGLFAVPLLHYVYRLSLRESVATSLVLVAATTSSATASELLHEGAALHGPTVLCLIGASFVGARLGFRVATRINPLHLKQVFCVVLLFVAARVISGERPTEQAGGIALFADIGYGAMDYATIVATGLCAGFVAPLLGVGGGLVAIPALVLLIEPLGYLGARASSMAMSMFNAWLSISLYQKIGGVRWCFGVWLAVGALVGGVVGVWAVHQPGLVPIARTLLAVTLVFVSGRFAYDALRAGKAGH